MKISVYHVDAFTNKVFAGNPAAVCLLDEWLPANLLQQIAAENNLPATAFLVPNNKAFDIRWFGPEYEIDLCGHGSLAAGFVIFNFLHPSLTEIELTHPAVGALKIQRKENFIILDFPAKTISVCDYDSILESALGMKPQETYECKKERLLVVLKNEEAVRQLKPDIHCLKQLEHRGVIVTAKGEQADFVSRVFYPKKANSEDPVTGSSYCLLVPYWHSQLHKNSFHAFQLSARGGEVRAELSGDRIYLFGNAILYKQGTISLF